MLKQLQSLFCVLIGITHLRRRLAIFHVPRFCAPRLHQRCSHPRRDTPLPEGRAPPVRLLHPPVDSQGRQALWFVHSVGIFREPRTVRFGISLLVRVTEVGSLLHSCSYNLERRTQYRSKQVRYAYPREPPPLLLFSHRTRNGLVEPQPQQGAQDGGTQPDLC